jgi:hypothetical protein
MGSVLMVSGYDANGSPVIYGSDDDGYAWKLLFDVPGGIFTTGNQQQQQQQPVYEFTHIPQVKLVSCGCGVVAVSVIRNESTLVCNDGSTYVQHSEVYRNVNWGVPGCWECLFEDHRPDNDLDGLMFITDIESAHVNDVMAVGRILGNESYFGIRFTSRESRYGKEWQ